MRVLILTLAKSVMGTITGKKISKQESVNVWKVIPNTKIHVFVVKLDVKFVTLLNVLNVIKMSIGILMEKVSANVKKDFIKMEIAVQNVCQDVFNVRKDNIVTAAIRKTISQTKTVFVYVNLNTSWMEQFALLAQLYPIA